MLSRWIDALPWLLALPLAGCGIFIDPDEYQDVAPAGSTNAAASSGSGAAGAAGSGGTGGCAVGGCGAGGSGGSGGTLSYRDVVLADDPIGYWRLGERMGAAVAIDETLNHNNGDYLQVATGAMGLVAGPDTAATFAGADDSYVDVGESFVFSANASYTLEVWLKPTTLAGAHELFRAKDSFDDGFRVWFDDQALTFDRGVGGDDTFTKVMPPILLTTMHVVATYDGLEVCLYANVADAECAPSPTAVSPIMAKMRIGPQVEGVLDEAAIYADVLPIDRIQAHFDAGDR